MEENRTTIGEVTISLDTRTVSRKKILRYIGIACILLSLPSFLIMTLCDSLWNKLPIIGPVLGIEFFIMSSVYKQENKTLRYVGWLALGSGALFVLYFLSIPSRC